MSSKLLHFLNNIESYVCSILLASFVTLMFIQIVSRQLFDYSFSWNEELSVYMFVWFVYLGASQAAKLAAHNRVTFQFKLMPAWMATSLELVSDCIWVFLNVYFIYLSYDFVFNKMNLFWKSQTLGIPMKYIFIILPVAFSLMTFRVLQVNYLKFIKGIDIRDPDSIELEELMDHEEASVNKLDCPNQADDLVLENPPQ